MEVRRVRLTEETNCGFVAFAHSSFQLSCRMFSSWTNRLINYVNLLTVIRSLSVVFNRLSGLQCVPDTTSVITRSSRKQQVHSHTNTDFGMCLALSRSDSLQSSVSLRSRNTSSGYLCVRSLLFESAFPHTHKRVLSVMDI